MFREKRRRRERAETISRGRQLFACDDDRATLEFLDDAVVKFPDDPEIWILLASASLQLRPDAVALHATKAAELGHEDPVTQVRAGHLLLGRAGMDAARECAERARRVAPSDFVLMAGLEGLEGKIASLNGEYERAEQLLRSAVRREPEYSTYPVDLARFLNNRGRVQEALAVIDESLEQVKDKDDLRRMRSEIATQI